MRINGACAHAFILVFMVMEGILSSSAFAGQIITPDQEEMCLLYYKFNGTQPPFETYAAEAPKVTHANEFNRRAALDSEIDRLKKEFSTLSDVDTISLNINMSLGEYDSSLGEFTLDGFQSDDYIHFECPFSGESVNLEFGNAPYAQSWPIPAKEAEDVLQKNKGSRSVDVMANIQLTSAKSTSSGPLVLIGNVKDVTVSSFTHKKLGFYAVPAK